MVYLSYLRRFFPSYRAPFAKRMKKWLTPKMVLVLLKECVSSVTLQYANEAFYPLRLLSTHRQKYQMLSFFLRHSLFPSSFYVFLSVFLSFVLSVIAFLFSFFFFTFFVSLFPFFPFCTLLGQSHLPHQGACLGTVFEFGDVFCFTDFQSVSF